MKKSSNYVVMFLGNVRNRKGKGRVRVYGIGNKRIDVPLTDGMSLAESRAEAIRLFEAGQGKPFKFRAPFEIEL